MITNITFCRYDNTTGRLTTRCVGTRDAMLAETGSYIEGDFDPSRYYLNLENMSLVEIPSRPSTLHDFDFITKKWVIDQEVLTKWVRSVRDRALQDSDWAERIEEPVAKLNWQIYRQLLRDITLNPIVYPVKWPIKPS